MKKILFSLLMLCCMTAAWAEPWPPQLYEVGSFERLKEVISHRMDNDRNCIADIKLTADIYLSDGEAETLCSTFSGTLDGNGHTIWAARPEVQHDGAGHYARGFVFTHLKDATIKNITYRNQRQQSDDWGNQAIITQTAENCTFENITFNNVSVWSNYSNVAAVAGYAKDCNFTNITVENSDFTVDGHIVGGIVGSSTNSIYTACKVDDRTLICSDGTRGAGDSAGGIVGTSDKDQFFDCINSAFVAGDVWETGGIVGEAFDISIDNCLNTGMVISISQSKVENGFFNKYKNKEMPYVTKYYKGQSYDVRKLTDDMIKEVNSNVGFAGLVGVIGEQIGHASTEHKDYIIKSANIGAVYSGSNTAGLVSKTYYNLQISDCFCDYFFGGGDSFDFIRDQTDGWTQVNYGKVTINNSLSLTEGTKSSCEGITLNNCYTRSANTVNAASLASGEICAKLGAAWEQNLGTDAYPTPTGDKGLYHTRKVSNEYGTICLPFPVKSDDEISYYGFESVATDDNSVTMKFSYLENVAAGEPVLFRATTDEIFIDKATGDYVWELGEPIVEDGVWTMEGTYQQRVFEGEDAKSIYYVSGGAIKNAKKTTIAPFRAYFHGPSIETLTGTNGAKSIRIILEDEDGETTAIQSPIEATGYKLQTTGIFNLAGQKVDDSYRGIVIKNGKKVVKK